MLTPYSHKQAERCEVHTAADRVYAGVVSQTIVNLRYRSDSLPTVMTANTESEQRGSIYIY